MSSCRRSLSTDCDSGSSDFRAARSGGKGAAVCVRRFRRTDAVIAMLCAIRYTQVLSLQSPRNRGNAVQIARLISWNKSSRSAGSDAYDPVSRRSGSSYCPRFDGTPEGDRQLARPVRNRGCSASRAHMGSLRNNRFLTKQLWMTTSYCVYTRAGLMLNDAPQLRSLSGTGEYCRVNTSFRFMDCKYRPC